MTISVRPECGREDRIGDVRGPFDFLQLVYTELQGPLGEDVALFDAKAGDWIVDGERYSDLVFFAGQPLEAAPAPYDPRFPVNDWKYEVANDDTRLSSQEWLAGKREINPEDGR